MPPSFGFDTAPSRLGTDSNKWNKYAGRDVLPMWVADMDFASPSTVQQALADRVAHGVYGYPDPSAGVAEAVTGWLADTYGWQVDPRWLVWLPGLVCGLNVVCRAVGEVGSGVVTATPVYPPFMSAPVLSQRELIPVPMRCEAGEWAWDIPALKAAITPTTRLLMLCNPHNPVGRVFRRDELEALAEIAVAHDLIVCADEIHCQLILDAHAVHLPFAALSPNLAKRTITLMAPSKTYNVPGLGCAFAIVPDAGLRAKMAGVMRGIVPGVNIFGYVGAEAAYRDRSGWLPALLDTLRQNRDAVVAAFADLPQVKLAHTEATYLAWLDLRASGLDQPAAAFEAGGVGLSDGADFGLSGFVRLNFACPPDRLAEGLRRMRAVLAPA